MTNTLLICSKLYYTVHITPFCIPAHANKITYIHEITKTQTEGILIMEDDINDASHIHKFIQICHTTHEECAVIVDIMVITLEDTVPYMLNDGMFKYIHIHVN